MPHPWGKVINSLLSPGVCVDSGAEVTDSVVMEGVQVGAKARVRRAILDKNVQIPVGAEVGYDLEGDRKRFTVTDSGIVAIPKAMAID